MWYLATVDNDGRCFGFLNKDFTINKDPDNSMDKLMKFKRKADTNELVMQINFSRALLPNSVGCAFSVAPVRR